ncbi:matrix protein [Belerina virus]|uniref:Matrix protein n=1 Tax=Belerina virus TaxID=2748342 RepID=A0A7D5IF23_9MONO|nr:matrix protein [Belerina virus]QKZ93215.1 matrix protein [Belerina virus]
MDGIAEFSKKSWEEGGTLIPFEAEADKSGMLIPKVRVVNPGWNDRKSPGYMYLIIYGIVEARSRTEKGGRHIKSFGAFPLGVGKSSEPPESLLEAVLKLDITVRRTAGSEEKIVLGTSNIQPELLPWKKILNQGAIFSAMKVCSSVELIPLHEILRLRPVFLTITQLTDAGCYTVPTSLLDFRLNDAISFNLLVEIVIGTDLSSTGIKGYLNDNGDKVTTFMVHIGNFVRKKGKTYSVDYCRQKVDRMDLRFSLGAVGGLSLHVKVAGKMSKMLRAQLGYKSTICYSLMDTNPFLNRIMWRCECSISKVSAVFQPSVPKEFRMYQDVIIDHTGKILRQK